MNLWWFGQFIVGTLHRRWQSHVSVGPSSTRYQRRFSMQAMCKRPTTHDEMLRLAKLHTERYRIVRATHHVKPLTGSWRV